MKELAKALQFLVNTPIDQLGNCAEYLDEECTVVHQDVQVVFPAALTAHALATMQSKQYAEYLNSLNEYLLKQKSKYNGFNYWVKDSDSARSFPLPDDIDDTACVLSALAKQNLDIDAEYFIPIMRLEHRVGGPYRTWYVDKKADTNNMWGDVDPVVNAHFLYMCSLMQIGLPKTRKFVLKQLNIHQLSSQYYPYDLTGLFYFTKYAVASQDKAAKAAIENELQIYSWTKLQPMEKLQYLLICSYLQIKFDKKRLTELLAYQNVDGSFPSWPMCYGFDLPGKIHTYVGSRVNTTALVAELLGNLLPAPEAVLTMAQRFVQNILPKGYELIDKHGLTRIITRDEIQNCRAFNLPIFYAQTLIHELNTEQLEIIENFSLSLFWGWAAYTLVDKYFDAEISLQYLPAILDLQRHSDEKLYLLGPEFKSRVIAAYDTCDRYYKWELTHCRFSAENISKLIGKRLGYSYITKRMQPFVVAISYFPKLLGFHDYELDTAIKFWNGVITIDQLNDDAHDYRDDFANGIMTYVLWRICQKSTDPKEHEVIFWTEVFDHVSDLCERQYRNSFSVMQVLPGKEFLRRVLDRSIAPVRKAEQEAANIAKLMEYF